MTGTIMLYVRASVKERTLEVFSPALILLHFIDSSLGKAQEQFPGTRVGVSRWAMQSHGDDETGRRVSFLGTVGTMHFEASHPASDLTRAVDLVAETLRSEGFAVTCVDEN